MEPAEVAEAFGVHPHTVNRWVREYGDGSSDGLAAIPHPGAPKKLTPKQERAVLRWIRKSPMAFGFADELWTAQRINHLIEKNFNVSFNTNYLCAWLASRRITPQKPQKVAAERNQRRVRYWETVVWPRIKKKRPRPAPTSF